MPNPANDLPRFSRALVALHAANDPAALRDATAATVNDFFPKAKSAVRAKWLRAFARAEHSAAAPPPAALLGHLVLELMWPHLVDCHIRLRSTAPSQSAVSTPRLTSREHEVLAGIAHGHKDAAIARRLGIGTRTVSQHVKNILAKLGVETRIAAVAVTRPRNTAHLD